MKRQKLRRHAFLILFGMSVSNDSPDEAMSNYLESFRGDYLNKDGEFSDEDMKFLENTVNGVYINRKEIDDIISGYSKGYEIARISRVALTALRISVFEMNFGSDVPVNVSVNEAVEIVKLYEDDKTRKFVNGILGSIAAEKTK